MGKKYYGWVLVFVVLLLVGSSMMMGHGYLQIGMGDGFALMVLFWAAVIWMIFELAKEKNEGKYPIEILRERYAKGEISKKKFEQMKKEIA